MNKLTIDNQRFINDVDLSFNKTHVIWEFSHICNLKCKYCYPSRVQHTFLTKNDYLTIAHIIEENQDIRYVHITGGEPTLNPYLIEVISAMPSKKILITTNLVLFDDAMIKRLCLLKNVYSIAISLDSLDSKINDYLRGCTSKVIRNIHKLLDLRKEHNYSFLVRIHSVITKINIDSLAELLLWAKKIGIDNVSCQPVSIDNKNPHCNEFSLSDAESILKAKEILQLEKQLFQTDYADVHSLLLEVLSKSDSILIQEQNTCVRFIDSVGEYWICPLRKRKIPSLDYKVGKTRCCLTMQCSTCLKRMNTK